MTPTTYDIYLLQADDSPLDHEGLFEVLRTLPLRRSADDPSRYFYRNDDTGVYFQLLLSPEVVASQAPPASQEDAESDEADSAADEEGPGAEDFEESEEESEEDDEHEEDAESFHIEMAPVTLTLPLVCPGFFGLEVVALAQALARAGNLSLSHPEHGEEDTADASDGDGVTPTDILTSWNAANREAANAAKERGSLTVWSGKKAEAWWTYGTHRPALLTEMSNTGIHVPRLEVAFHGQQIKSLCSWDLTTPVLLPRTDLVLIRREQRRKGLLFNRRVTIEGLVSGETLWNLLAAFSEIRSEPVELLVYRDAARPSQQVAAALEVLSLEPLESAQRAELTGSKLSGVGLTWMVDFEPDVAEEERT